MSYLSVGLTVSRVDAGKRLEFPPRLAAYVAGAPKGARCLFGYHIVLYPERWLGLPTKPRTRRKPSIQRQAYVSLFEDVARSFSTYEMSIHHDHISGAGHF